VNYQTPKRNITSSVALLWLSEIQQVTGRIFRITKRNHYFDAFPNGHKKTPIGVGVGGSGWLEG
jgi:hypothetical protein